MKKRQWSGQEKLKIVLEGMHGNRRISELCNHHEITQNQYYKWRDQFYENAPQLFEKSPDKKVIQLENKVKKLTGIIGDLTVELKKNDFDLKGSN